MDTLEKAAPVIRRLDGKATPAYRLADPMIGVQTRHWKNGSGLAVAQ
ncbi:hypothetical protein [Labrys miyagiensis]